VVVKLREEAAAVRRVATDGAREEQGRHEAEHNQANHGSRHGRMQAKLYFAVHYVVSDERRELVLVVCVVRWSEH
jgi:hypothetical protein